MKKLLYILMFFLIWQETSKAQTLPNSVCTSPAEYNFDEEVTWYFDLSGNTIINPGDKVYYWSWEPRTLPGGRALLNYEGNWVWSLTFKPTELYGLTLEEIQDAGDAAFWCSLQNEAGTGITGTIPYPMKEQLRLGNACANEPKTYRSFFFDFGPNDITNGNITANPDNNGNYWNNPTNVSGSADPLYLVDKENNLTEANLTIVSDLMKNGIKNGGLLAPEDSLLGEFAIATATQDYFFHTSKGTFSLNGLDTNKGYIFSMFASRNSDQVRKTKYTLKGATLLIDSLQSSGTGIGGPSYNGNNSDVLVLGPVVPDQWGRIQISLSVLEGGFAYLNLMKVVEVDPNPTIYIDFGPNDVTNGNITVSPDKNGNYWNNATNPGTSSAPVNLFDKFNYKTGSYIKVKTDLQMNGIQNGGLLAPEDSLLGDFAIESATQDYFFTTSTGELEIGALDTTSSFVFSFFGTRNSTSDRITTYTLTGKNTYNGNHQTSGTDLGGTGYNGNNSIILVSDTISPDESGKISLQIAVSEGGFAYIGCLKIEEILATLEPEPICSIKDSLKIAYMGSSVAYGFGATNNKGYAFQHSELLSQRHTDGEGYNWHTDNISIGGNNTIALLNRWENDLLPLCSGYVVYGLSLGNEGIHEQGQPMFDQFRDNMLILIDMAREEGIEPLVVNCYARNDFNNDDYNYTKEMNLLIHNWDVASVNVLGAIDNGEGKWAPGYWHDSYHPNTIGHTEMMYSIVPSLFDALADGKPQPQRIAGTYMEMGTSKSENKLVLSPENIVHSFTVSVDFKTSTSGTVISFAQEDREGKVSIDSRSGKFYYATPDGEILNGNIEVNNNNWHNLTLTHYYAAGKTILYTDAKEDIIVNEKLVPMEFSLNDKNAPVAIDYKNWLFYRAGMTPDEISALTSGEMLKSSLELYAPLDGQQVLGDDPLINMAQSLNTIKEEPAVPTSANINNFNSENNFSVFPNPVSGNSQIRFYNSENGLVDISLFNINGQKLGTVLHDYRLAGWHSVSWESKANSRSLPNGIYIFRFNSGETIIPYKIVVKN